MTNNIHGPSKLDVWTRLAEPLPPDAIKWRQDGKPITRDGKRLARFVAYVEANVVRERLDAVIPGEWDLILELLPQQADEDGVAQVAFKARLQILGVIREDVGAGRDYKAAATDAFKRAAVRFGIAHELYGYGQNWVPVDGDGRFAKPLEEPGVVYARRHGRASHGDANGSGERENEPRSRDPRPSRERKAPEDGDVIHDGTGDPKVVGEPDCPKCGGRMWDNRLSKRNPKAPDYKCRDRSCDGVIWPGQKADAKADAKAAARADSEPADFEDFPGVLNDDDDDLPF
jgi:hypothetical protein